MDKQKQIEKSKSCYSCNHYYACEDCYKAFTRSKDYFKKHIAHNREIAMRCKYYQPKIPEGAVVLTQEEYEDLKIAKDFNYGYHNGESNMTSYYENIRLPEARKETAEKFADKLLCKYIDFGNYDEISVGSVREDIDEICKEFTESK